MVAKMGVVNAWHYAHKGSNGERCDPDTALHEAAKAMVVQGVTNALCLGGDYIAEVTCRRCRTVVSTNVAHTSGNASMERSVVDRTRSDIVIDRGPRRKPVIVEIVVTHDLEPDTESRYKKSGLPVLVVRPDWDTVVSLLTSLNTDSSLNIDCVKCRHAKARRQQELSDAHEWVATTLGRLNPGSKSSFRQWEHDKHGNVMGQPAGERVRRNASILVGLGFSQTRKPWLFVFNLPSEPGKFASAGVIFANFGSTNEVPIQEDQSALIHWNLQAGVSEAKERALIRRVLRECRAAGAEVRLSFYQQNLDPEP